jgi:hypothetical protein
MVNQADLILDEEDENRIRVVIAQDGNVINVDFGKKI